MAFARHQARGRWMAAPVIAVAVAACISGITNELTQDDAELILESTRFHELSQWREILTSPYWPPPYTPDLYRPLTSLLLALQYTIGFGTPLVFRAASYALYAGCSVLVFKLATRALPTGVALFVGLLFAAHPVHVEALVLAVAQNEILVALLTTLAVLLYLDRRQTGNGELQRRDWAVLGALYVAAALSKEQGFFLPGFILLAELFLVLGYTRGERFLTLWKGYVTIGLLGAAAFLARAAVLAEYAVRPDVAEALLPLTFAGRVVTMLQILPEWLRLLAWPAHLRADYSPQEFVGSTSFGAQETLGLLLLLLAAAVVVLTRRRAPVVAFGLSWCALALFPVSNTLVPTGVLIAERTLFLPSIGFMLAVGAAAALVLERWPERRQSLVRALVIGGTALVVAGVIRSALRQRVYRDTQTLSLASVHDSPRSWRVHQAYGEAMFDLGRPIEGEAAYLRAIGLAPSPWWVRNSLARRLRLIGNDSGALEQLQLSLGEYPAQTDALPEMAAALIALGRYDDARRLANQVLSLPDAPAIMMWLRQVADSALTTGAPPGSIRIGLSTNAK